MVFYGIQHDYDTQINQLEWTIEELKQIQRQEQIQNATEFAIPPINIRTAGEVITQSILSGQFVASCISSYF